MWTFHCKEVGPVGPPRPSRSIFWKLLYIKRLDLFDLYVLKLENLALFHRVLFRQSEVWTFYYGEVGTIGPLCPIRSKISTFHRKTVGTVGPPSPRRSTFWTFYM